MSRILFLAALLLCLSVHAQSDSIDPRKKDSFILQLEQKRLQMKERTDSIMRRVDSLNAIMAAQQREQMLDQNQKNLESLMRTMKEREKKEQRQAMIRFGIAGLLLVFLGWNWWRRRKKSQTAGGNK